MIDKIFLHCSDSPHGLKTTAATIHAWHRENGWDGIGYHHVILEDGTVENGRPYWWTGAHAKNHNLNSIGVCLIGEGVYTREQKLALIHLLKELTELYPKADILEHRVVDPTKGCPLFDSNIQNLIKTFFGSTFKYIEAGI